MYGLNRLRKNSGPGRKDVPQGSGRTMARTGLRMMPTFPSSPLKFRTAGFPRYGFKAGYQRAPSLEWHPRVVPSRFTTRLRAHRCNVSCSAQCRSTLCAQAPPFKRLRRSTPGALAPVRVLLSRSILTYPAPSAPLAGTARFRCLQLIRPVLAVRFRLGDPRLVPCFHRSFFLNMSPSTTPGSLAAVCTQFLHRQRWPSSLQHRLGTPIHPTNPFHVGGTFRSFTTVRLRYDLLICSPS